MGHSAASVGDGLNAGRVHLVLRRGPAFTAPVSRQHWTAFPSCGHLLSRLRTGADIVAEPHGNELCSTSLSKTSLAIALVQNAEVESQKWQDDADQRKPGPDSRAEEVCSEIDMKTVHFKTSEDCGDRGAGSEKPAKNSDQHDIAFFVACTPS